MINTGEGSISKGINMNKRKITTTAYILNIISRLYLADIEWDMHNALLLQADALQ
jgi:hypothetical protein